MNTSTQEQQTQKPKAKKGVVKHLFSFGKLVALFAVLLGIAALGGQFLLNNNINGDKILAFTQKHWILSNIVAYSLYLVIAFIITPIYLNRRLVRKDNAIKEWMTKKKLLIISSGVFAFLVVLDMLTVQLPYSRMIGG